MTGTLHEDQYTVLILSRSLTFHTQVVEKIKTRFLCLTTDLFFRKSSRLSVNLLKPTGHVMHQQFNIQQLYVLPHTVFMCFVFI